MKRALEWFIAKSESRKITAIRIILGILLAVLFWIFILLLGKIMVDQQNTEKLLEEQDWLKFFKSNIRHAIINRYGNFLIGVLIAITGYKIFNKPAVWLVKKYFPSKIKFELFFQSSFPSLPHPEFIFLLPGHSYACFIILRNKSESLKISGIEIVTAVNQDVIFDHVDRNHITETFNWLHFEAEEDQEELGKALIWKQISDRTFKMDTPFILEAGEEIQLPGIYPTALETDINDLEDYVNNMDLEIRFNIALYANEDRYTKTISAPLRILVWDDEFLLVKGIDEMPAGSKNSRDDFLRLADDIQKDDAETRRVAIQIATREFQLEEITNLKKKLSDEPQNAELCFQLAIILRDTIQYGEAMKYMNMAFDLGLDSVEFHRERLQTGFVAGASYGTKNSAERLLDLQPDADAHLFMGELLSIEEKPEEALKNFDAALKLDPNSSAAAYWKSRIMNEFEDHKAGLEWLNKSIALDPDYRDAYIDRAITLFKLGKAEMALESISQALNKGFKDLEWLESIRGELKGNTKRKFNKLIAPLRKSV